MNKQTCKLFEYGFPESKPSAEAIPRNPVSTKNKFVCVV